MASSFAAARKRAAPSSRGGVGKDVSVCRSETPRHDRRFPRSCRLTSRRQFLEVYKKGRRASTASLTVFGTTNNVGYSRIGLTVSRKVGGAVLRSRVKRLLREVFRLHRQEFEPPMDLVINVHRSVSGRTLRQLAEEMRGAFTRLAKRSGQ